RSIIDPDGPPREPGDMTVLRQEISETLGRGLELCRRGEWDLGLRYLGRLAEAGERTALPGLFYSYLGYGIALRQQRIDEGLRLCQHSVKVEFYQPENYLN